MFSIENEKMSSASELESPFLRCNLLKTTFGPRPNKSILVSQSALSTFDKLNVNSLNFLFIIIIIYLEDSNN